MGKTLRGLYLVNKLSNRGWGEERERKEGRRKVGAWEGRREEGGMRKESGRAIPISGLTVRQYPLGPSCRNRTLFTSYIVCSKLNILLLFIVP